MFFSINEVHSLFKKKKKKKCLRLGVIIASESSDGHTAQRHFFAFFPDTVRGKWEERKASLLQVNQVMGTQFFIIQEKKIK